jgi:hypothetical protein
MQRRNLCGPPRHDVKLQKAYIMWGAHRNALRSGDKRRCKKDGLYPFLSPLIRPLPVPGLPSVPSGFGPARPEWPLHNVVGLEPTGHHVSVVFMGVEPTGPIIRAVGPRPALVRAAGVWVPLSSPVLPCPPDGVRLRPCLPV